ncbi:GNAT family N-acetyltransferase [Candidatus Bathyarchaeota archaeon]|nr:GNAT family N-acetyltransferase [Candidatus Bathyarchaeota archaeon]
METPLLTTERLALRPMTEDDIGFIYELFGRHETNEYSSYGDVGSLEEAKRLYEAFMAPGHEDRFRVAIVLRETGEPIGTLGLHGFSGRDGRAELGYDLLREHWGRGYMTEAARELVRYGFAEMGLNRIEATIDPENKRSVNLIERLGFMREGLLREKYFYGGRRRDELVYGLLRSDWEEHIMPPKHSPSYSPSTQ